MSSLLVCSNSTKNYLNGFDRVRVVTSAPDIGILGEVGTEESIVAIGGGAVIDTAKILCKNPIDCYPTTAAGSSATSWSVYWNGTEKCSFKAQKPNVVTFNRGFIETLPNDMIIETTYDVVSHCLDSLHSNKATDKSKEYCNTALEWLRKYKDDNLYLVKAGHEAGNAIEIAGTNLLHSLSYPLTGHYGISHGLALGYFLSRISKFLDYDVSDIIEDFSFTRPHWSLFNIDIDFVIDEALKYDKIYESKMLISKEILQEVLI